MQPSRATRTRRAGGALGVISGVGLPGFNGIWGEATLVDPAALAGLMDDVRSAGVPHTLQLRPGWPAEIAQIACERGLVRVQGEPLMVLDDDRDLDAALAVDGLSIRQLAPDEGDVHARVAAAGGVVRNEAPYRMLTTAEVIATPGLRVYVGGVDGEAVTTALGIISGGCVGIFGVTTLPRHRKRGYGGAVTARAARDALDEGTRWASLAASRAGYPVYRKLGFVTVERTDLWEFLPD